MKYPTYYKFCKQLQIEPLEKADEISRYYFKSELDHQTHEQQVTAQLYAFVSLAAGEECKENQLDEQYLDCLIGKVDAKLNQQLDEILHHPEFQVIESVWRALFFMVNRLDFNANIKVEMLNVSKESLKKDFHASTDITQSGLYNQVYEEDYGAFNDEPISAIISGFCFSSERDDIALLSNLSKIASMTHSLFIGSVDAEFFGKTDVAEVLNIQDLSGHMKKSHFIEWNNFRNSEESKYIGLTFSDFLLRKPYGVENPVRSFYYHEDVYNDSQKYLWGASNFAFAVTVANHFKDDRWFDKFRMAASDGKLPKTSELASLGFIPLNAHRNAGDRFFYSFNSVKIPALFDDQVEWVYSQISTRFFYVFLYCRFACYLKMLQGKVLDADLNCEKLEQWLTRILHLNAAASEKRDLCPSYFKIRTS